MTVSIEARFAKRAGPTLKPNWARMYQDEYVVITDTPMTGDTVRKLAGLPQMGTANPDDPPAIVVSVGPPRQQGELVWYVPVRWETQGVDGKKPPGENPIEDPPTYRWEAVHYTETRSRDVNGKPFQDAADTPFENPPKFQRSNLKLIVVRNELVFNPAVALQYANKVNADQFWGQAIGTAKCDMPVAVSRQRGDIDFWSITYGIEFNAPKTDDDGNSVINPWNPTYVLNEGPRYFEMAGNTKVLKVADDDLGVAHGGMVHLSPDGFLLLQHEGEGPEYNPNDIEFVMYESIDFAGLNL